MAAGATPASEPGIGDWVAAGRRRGRRRHRQAARGRGPRPAPAAAGAPGRPCSEATALGEDQRPQAHARSRRCWLATGRSWWMPGLDPVRPAFGSSTARHRPVCVLRSCYLALTRAQQVAGPYDRVVLVEEPGRALRDPRRRPPPIGASHVERVAWDPRVARSVDAGTIVSMLPPPLRRFELASMTSSAAATLQGSSVSLGAATLRGSSVGLGPARQAPTTVEGQPFGGARRGRSTEGWSTRWSSRSRCRPPTSPSIVRALAPLTPADVVDDVVERVTARVHGLGPGGAAARRPDGERGDDQRAGTGVDRTGWPP